MPNASPQTSRGPNQAGLPRIDQDVLDALTRDFSADAAMHDEQASIPHKNFARLHSLSLLSLTVPRENGGADADLKTVASVVRAIARGEPATALIATMQYFAHRLVLRLADEKQSQVALASVRKAAVERGELANALRVEPALGTPQRGGLPDTVAVRSNDGWRLSGHKIFSTGAPILDWLLVWARTDEQDVRVGHFLVPKGSAGVSIRETWNHLGLRASRSDDVILDDVRIPFEFAIDLRPLAPPEAFSAGTGDIGPNQQMSWLCALLGNLYDGIAVEARDWLVSYLTQRKPKNLGASLSTLPRFQEAIGRIDTLLLTNASLLDRLISAADAQQPLSTAQAGLIKLTVTDNALQVVQSAVELVGNAGLSRHFPLERHLRDVLCGRVHTPQPDAALGLAGREAFAALPPRTDARIPSPHL